MSFLAWIDFDQTDRDRTRRIMDLFGQEDSRDELGLGSVRDALADLMFPGTSTIQTRLRYMLFVPWIYQIAGELKGTASARREHARVLEIRLIEALLRGGETRNVIGSDSREKLKRLPSDVYWAGLLTLGIRRFQGSRNACLEATPGEAAALWAAGLPPAPDGFLSSPDSTAVFRLRNEEAGFLRDRLAHEAPHSLLTHLSRQITAADCDMIWHHPARSEWPDGIIAVVDHAERFSRLMHGASLLYNLMLSERAARMQGTKGGAWHERVETYSGKLDDWAEETPVRLFEDWDLRGLWLLAQGTTHDVKPHSRRFIETWRDSVMATRGRVHEDRAARALVSNREARLKGAKSRFRNEGALMRWSGASGTAMMNFRWQPVVANHVRDLVDAD
ncbi:hypothetical protein D6850_04990 [Roseovarius spongiae]|uniref:Uncharacterized protein n=1 Tax=Roseovarius spongiae TaxID=2320272 RepID=A0A3A8AY80_9RHOB|nr:DUF6361 family protein [Roseovarius spongiae]RKF16887.1 hypothetical protein D6850_04990 [Roseovarius spongiae]